MISGYRPYYLRVEGTIEPQTAFHIGSGQNFHTSSDSPLLRLRNDPAGNLYLPGSSLRGILRAHLEREAPLLGCTPEHIDSLFGKAVDQTGTYGRLRIFDANPIENNSAELRDHVRINPTWGAADYGAKFDMETGFAKQGFAFCANYQGDGPSDPELRLFREALRFLQSEEFRIGAKSGWGLGRMELSKKLTIREYDRSTDTGLLEYLKWRLNPDCAATGELPNPTPSPASAASEAWNTITLHLALHFEGPVLVKSAIPVPRVPDIAEATFTDPATYWKQALQNTDATFVATIDPLQETYYLPGSSLRGVLRHEALWIAGAESRRIAEVNEIFGTASGNDEGEAGLVEIEDGVIADACFVFLDHVAIDRIVQGAADGRKFDSVALESPRFKVRLTMRFKTGQSSLVRWLAALLKQMKSGRLWAGSATSRGYGLLKTIQMESATLNFTNDLGWNLESARQELPGRSIYTTQESGVLESVWTKSRKAFQEAAK